MPILPIKSLDEFWNLFNSSFEFIFVIFYSTACENTYIEHDEKYRKELNKCCEYLDRLSNSYKYSHVLFAEIDSARIKTMHSYGFGVIPDPWPVCNLFERRSRHIIHYNMSCYSLEYIRNILKPTLKLKDSDSKN